MSELDVLDWPVDRLRAWQVYDEVEYMLKRTAQTFKKASPADVVRLVCQDQDKHGWRGVLSEGDQ